MPLEYNILVRNSLVISQNTGLGCGHTLTYVYCIQCALNLQENPYFLTDPVLIVDYIWIRDLGLRQGLQEKEPELNKSENKVVRINSSARTIIPIQYNSYGDICRQRRYCYGISGRKREIYGRNQ